MPRRGCEPWRRSRSYPVSARSRLSSAARAGSQACGAAQRRRHEFRADRVADAVGKDAVDLGPGRRIEPPPADLVHRLQLARVASPPERRGNALVEHPADGEVDDSLVEAPSGKVIEPLHGSKVLAEAWLLEFGIGAAKIVAVERTAGCHAAGQKAAAKRAISERRDFVLSAIGQDLVFDA